MRGSRPRSPEDVEKAAQAEAERYFAARGARAKPGRAKALLAKAGRRAAPRPEDRLEPLSEKSESQ